MPVRIPTDASPQLQEALRGIELRLAALEARPVADPGVASQVSAVRTQLDALAAGPAYGDEWNEMVPAGPQHQRGLTPDPAPNAGLGTERVLHENGTWRRVLDGLAQVIPEGIGRPTHAARVLELLADLAVAGSIGASEGHFKALRSADIPVHPRPGAALYKASDWTHNSTGNWLKMPFDTANEDAGAMCDTTNSQLVCKTPGLFRVTAQALFDTIGSAIVRALEVYVAGAALPTIRPYAQATTAGYWCAGIAGSLRLTAGQTVSLYLFQASGGNQVVLADRTWLTLQWVRP